MGHIKMKTIICVGCTQGLIFKRIKEKHDFITIIKDFGITKSTMIFDINEEKLLDKYLKLKSLSMDYMNTSSRSQIFFKIVTSGLAQRLWHRFFPLNFAKLLRIAFLKELLQWLLLHEELLLAN